MRGQQRGSTPQPTQIGIIHYTCAIPGVCVSKQTSAHWLICSVFAKSGTVTHLWCLKEPTEPPHPHTGTFRFHRSNILTMVKGSEKEELISSDVLLVLKRANYKNLKHLQSLNARLRLELDLTRVFSRDRGCLT